MGGGGIILSAEGVKFLGGAGACFPAKFWKSELLELLEMHLKLIIVKKMVMNLSAARQNKAVLHRIKVLESVKQNHKQNKWVSFLDFFFLIFYKGPFKGNHSKNHFYKYVSL